MTNNMNNNSNKVAIAAAASSVVAVLLTMMIYKKTRNDKRHNNNTLLSEEKSAGATLESMASQNPPELFPPLPDLIKQLLNHSHLAYLSTIDLDSKGSHLSLMRFTYLPDEELIVMSTNRKTKKFDLLKKQENVALLVHDFGSGVSGIGGSYSITLNGRCFIVDDPTERERFRAAHLEHNPDYPQFIVGPDIAILCVRVINARVCNINDQVQKWDVVSSQNIQ